MAALKSIFLSFFIVFSFVFSSLAGFVVPNHFEFYTLAQNPGFLDVQTRNDGLVESHLALIDPISGDLRTIGYTGFVNCKALDFNLEGDLYSKCQRPVAPHEPVLVKIDPVTGKGTEIGETGVTENISDITITPDQNLFAYEETGDAHNFHQVDAGTGAAGLIGNPGLEGQGNALFDLVAPYGIKLVTFVDGINQVYTIDMDTAEPKLIANLEMIDPDGLAMAAEDGPCLLIAADALAGGVAADDVLMAQLEERQTSARGADILAVYEAAALIEVPVIAAGGAGNVQTNLIAGANMALGFIDLDAGIARIHTLINTGYVLDGLAVKKIEPRPIPTMSEWGFIVTSVLLFLFGLYFLVRRKNVINTV